MNDVVDKDTRSRMMSQIRGQNTKPEMILRKALHAKGFRYRLHSRNLPGKPDLVFPRYHAAIFVHGCFWHRHVGCRYATVPATRVDFWHDKFQKNIDRDKRNINELKKEGWRVLVVWECELKGKNCQDAIERASEWLTLSK